MMLGGRLLQAVVLLAPTLASARSIATLFEPPAHLITPAETPFFAEIYLGNHGDASNPPQLLATLNLENLESSSCDASSITVDGEPLFQDQDGFGRGLFTGHDANFGAAWSLKCSEDSLDKLTFTIHSINRVVVHGIEFEVDIKRGARPEIVSVSGIKHFVEPDGLNLQLAQLEKMEAELSALKNKIALKQQSGSPYHNSCDTVKCRLNGYISHVFKKIGSAVESAYPSSQIEGSQKPISPYNNGDNSVQKTMGSLDSDDAVKSESSAQEPTNRQQPPTKIHVTKDSRRYYALLLAAGATGIMIISLIIGISYSRCRCAGEKRETCLARRRRRQNARHHYEEQETEKPTEPKTAISSLLKARSTEALSWVQASLKRNQVADEEKAAQSFQVDNIPSSNDVVALRVDIPPHPPQYSRHPSVEMPKSSRQSFASLRPAETDSDSDSDQLSTTMEQDLAQFRAVAGMFENMVAAGSIRTPGSAPAAATKQRTRGQSSASTSSGRSWRPRTPPSPSTTLPSYHSDEEYPPGYESGPDDEPRDFVADGFQYHLSDGAGPGHSSDQSRTLPPMAGESPLDEHLGRKE